MSGSPNTAGVLSIKDADRTVLPGLVDRMPASLLEVIPDSEILASGVRAKLRFRSFFRVRGLLIGEYPRYDTSSRYSPSSIVIV